MIPAVISVFVYLTGIVCTFKLLVWLTRDDKPFEPIGVMFIIFGAFLWPITLMVVALGAYIDWLSKRLNK